MKYRALVTFTGEITMAINDVRTIDKEELIEDLLQAKYIEPAEESKIESKDKFEEPKKELEDKVEEPKIELEDKKVIANSKPKKVTSKAKVNED